MTAHAHLRAATREAHEAVDARFARYDLGNRREYEEFLLAHAEAFLPAEQAIAEADSNVPAGIMENRRSAALRRDLAELGLEAPKPRSFGPLESAPEALGAAYVLEGSRLGGIVLARQVGDGLPTDFLAAATPVGHWRSFIAYLDQHLNDEQSIADATRSALETFALFNSSMGERA